MKRLLRRSFNVAVLGSAMLFVATCALWIVSEKHAVYIWARAGLHAVSCISEEGTIQFKFVPRDPGRTEVRWVQPRQIDDLIAIFDSTFYSPLLNQEDGYGHGVLSRFAISSDKEYPMLYRGPSPAGPHSRYWYLIVPHWFLVICAVMLPVSWLVTRYRRHRRTELRPGYCVCGYDLRATLDRCPECGTVPTVKGTT